MFFNLLLLGYALPAVLALLLSYAVAGRRPAGYANTIAAAALVLALTYVTFEIRRLYHGPVLTDGPTTGVEQYTYSIAWLAFGVALLGIGIFFNSQRARLASAVVIALTILKAFLIDMSTLTGVYRALSFMCLGLVLVAIGWLYQRILFRRQATAGRTRRAAGAARARSAAPGATRIVLPIHGVSRGSAKTFSEHSLKLKSSIASTIVSPRDHRSRDANFISHAQLAHRAGPVHGGPCHENTRSPDIRRHRLRICRHDRCGGPAGAGGWGARRIIRPMRRRPCAARAN